MSNSNIDQHTIHSNTFAMKTKSSCRMETKNSNFSCLSQISVFSAMCGSRKYPYPPQGRSLEILRGRGSQKPKCLTESLSGISRGVGANQKKTFVWWWVWIFSGTTQYNIKLNLELHVSWNYFSCSTIVIGFHFLSALVTV